MLKFHLLGRVQITMVGQPVTDFASEKELLLLCYLLLNPREHSRPQLAGLLWGEMSEERARANLSTAVYNLRQLLPNAIDAGRKTAAFNPDQPVWLDTAVLQKALNNDAETLEAAVAHYRGPFLEGIYPQDAPELEMWLQQERERWRLLALTGLDRLSQQQSQDGEWEKAITNLRRLLAIEPWREESHRALMRLLARTGQFNTALVQYESCRALLEQELGVEPMAETTAVYQRIQAARQRPQPYNLPPQPTPLVGRAAELGQLFTWFNDPARRLITLAGPGGSGKTRLGLAAASDQAYAFLDGVVFVPLAEATSRVGLVQAIAATLGLTLAVGAEQEQLLSYLRDKEILLLLDNIEQALEPAASLIVALLENASRLRLLVTSREYLQLRWETRLPLPGLPTPPAAAVDITAFDAVQLFMQMGQRVQPDFTLAGQETAVADLCRLVEGTPLALELAASLLDTESPPQLLAQIRQSFDQLATTMRDVPVRHRSLRAVFDHSWALLTATQQAALARLALFRGGFTPQAAAAVAGTSPVLLAGLAAKTLIRATADGRFTLHEMIRQYALEQLEDGQQAAMDHAVYFAAQVQQATDVLHSSAQTAVAHQLLADVDNIQAAWQTGTNIANADLLLKMAPGLTRFYQVAGLYGAGAAAFTAATTCLPTVAEPYLYRAIFLLEQHEYAAVLTAVTTAVELGLTNPALVAQANQVAASAHLRLGDSAAAQTMATRALTEAQAANLPFLQAQAWRILGMVREQAGDYAVAEDALRQALTIYEASGDPLGVAQTCQGLGTIYFRRNEYEAARSLLEKALAVQRQVDPSGLSSARVLVSLGSVTYNLNQREEARRYFQEALAVFRQSGDRSGEALAADMLGRMAAFACQFDEARVYFEQALALCRAIGQTKRMADTQRHLADLASSLGAYGEAEELLTAVWQTYTAIQDRRSAGTTLTRLALLHHYQGDDKTAQEWAETALTIAEEVASPILHGYALTSLGVALRGQEQWEKSAAVYRQAISVWQELGMTGLQAETQAALAAVFYYATGRLDDAWPLLEPALAYLTESPQPDCEAPGDFYLDCIMLLQARGDKRADSLLHQAVQILYQQAASIAEAQTRIAFLEGIDAHQKLLSEYWLQAERVNSSLTLPLSQIW